MEEPDFTIFSTLFREACAKCFGQPLNEPLTESESKLFYRQILEHTGLTVGWRSLKNYSFFVLQTDADKQENPSIATMDTLARYVLNAPYTNEINRKNDEHHNPYWYKYRQAHLTKPQVNIAAPNRNVLKVVVLGLALLGIAAGLFIIYKDHSSKLKFADNFKDVSDTALTKRGWQVLNKNDEYWAKRGTTMPGLTLYTLNGDNWPDGSTPSFINNLLIRELPKGCFVTELQMADFIPAGEWQQAGLLLMQDTSLNSPTIRISLAYNDFFGGYKRPKEVIVQGISSQGYNSKPEEFVHFTVLTPDSITQNATLLSNLKNSALRIEKNNNTYRFLFSCGRTANTAFRQLISTEFNFEPHYIAIFAIKGKVKPTPVIPVKIKQFMLESMPCSK